MPLYGWVMVCVSNWLSHCGWEVVVPAMMTYGYGTATPTVHKTAPLLGGATVYSR